MLKQDMTGHEKIAYRNIKGIFDWEVGGWYNCIQDGCEEYIPDTIEEAKQIVYDEAMTDRASAGHYSVGRAPTEMRFAGEEFIRGVIDFLFKHDGDAKEIAEVKAWNA